MSKTNEDFERKDLDLQCPRIEQEILDQVLAFSGPSGGYEPLVNVFVRSSHDRLGQLKLAICEKRFGDIKNLSHSLKGSCAIFGARSLADQWQQFEDICEGISSEDLGHQFDSLERQVSALHAFLMKQKFIETH